MAYKYKNDELRKYLEEKKVFKLICGANNENYEEITKLVRLYSDAGARFFDINASKEAIVACKSGLKDKDNCFICVSVGTKNDPHMTKCKINSNCKSCGLCKNVCNQGAIKDNKIIEKNCIGCKKCVSVCKYGAIDTHQKEINIEKILDTVKEADCIEFHIITDDTDEILTKWKYITKNYGGYLSIALNRSLFSDKIMFDILSKMINMSENQNIMIQADGSAMSGGVDSYNSTLQAVATADCLIKQGFKLPVIISGGTNSKSAELAKICDVNLNGIAIGSYARKIVRDYMDKNPNKALSLAKKLVLACLGKS